MSREWLVRPPPHRYRDTALIGARGVRNTGWVYGFVRGRAGHWREQAKLAASDGGSGDRFGFPVSVFADAAAIGANKGSVGLVYVFVRDGSGNWYEQES